MAHLDQFLCDCADEIVRCASLDPDRWMPLEAGARAFSAAVETASPRDHDLTTVPAADWLDRLADGPLVGSFAAARHQLTWIPSPRSADGGVERALSPLNDVRDLGDLTCGLMLLAPGHSYPEHAHPPQEIYLPISGAGLWRHGGAPDFRQLGPDELAYNPHHAVHSTQAGKDPLLALYVLWT